MNKFFLFIAITLFFSLPIIAEVLDYTLTYDKYENSIYTNNVDMVSQDVSSDFGWRYRQSGTPPTWIYQWHKGDDFAFSEGSRLRSLHSGAIDRIYNSSTSGYKYIVISENMGLDDIFGYGHIFDNGNCLTKYLTNL